MNHFDLFFLQVCFYINEIATFLFSKVPSTPLPANLKHFWKITSFFHFLHLFFHELRVTRVCSFIELKNKSTENNLSRITADKVLTKCVKNFKIWAQQQKGNFFTHAGFESPQSFVQQSEQGGWVKAFLSVIKYHYSAEFRSCSKVLSLKKCLKTRPKKLKRWPWAIRAITANKHIRQRWQWLKMMLPIAKKPITSAG